MKLTTFLGMQCKRIWKNKPFLLLLLIFPLCLFLLSNAFHTEEDSRIAVGVCLDTKDPLADTLYQKLIVLEDSLFRFSPVATEEDLIRQVQSNQLECGYLFRKDLGKELDKNHLKNLITVYVSENTTCKGVLNELVYANLFEEYSLSLLENALTDASHLPFSKKDAERFALPPVTTKDIEERYRSHLTDGSTFRFDVQFVSQKSEAAQTGTTATTVPLLRGFTAIFLLLCGFLAMLTTYNDQRNGLYERIRGTGRFLLPRITQLTFLLPAGVIGLIGLGITGSLQGFLRELVALFCYILALLVFYTILASLIHNHTMLCAAFPMLLLCTLIFTPVIVDLSSFFPWMKLVRYVLPTYYYLLFF